MLPEQVAQLLETEDYSRLSHKFDALMDNDYYYSRYKLEITNFVAELATLAYKKGCKDERYYSSGPAPISAYE